MICKSPLSSQRTAKSIRRTFLQGKLTVFLVALLAPCLLLADPYVINPVEDFGADGSDGEDDWRSLQDAFNQAARLIAKGKASEVTVHLPAGVYYSSNTLRIKSNVELKGDGLSTEIRPLADDAGNIPSPLILARKVNGGHYHHFQVNGLSSSSTATTGSIGLHLAGSSNIRIEHIRTFDIGRTKDIIGGTHLLISASEPERPSRAADGPPGVPSLNNTVAHCEFLDPFYTTSFLLRLKTDWKLAKATEEYQTAVSGNVVRHNTFVGGFWNAVEFAGPKTIFNVLSFNTFEKALQTAFESDKAASFNWFEGNRIFDIRPNSLESSEATLSQNAMVMAIRDQGVGNREHLHPERFATGNTYVGNVINSITGVYQKTGAFLLNRSHGATFADNALKSIQVPGKSVEPAAFFFWHTVEGANLAGNKIPAGVNHSKDLGN